MLKLAGEEVSISTAVQDLISSCRAEPERDSRIDSVVEAGESHASYKMQNEWRGHQVHNIIISCATQITPGSCPLRDEDPPGPSELLSATLGNCSIPLSRMIFFFHFMLETALPQAHSFTHVACPIHSAPIQVLTKSNTACPPPSALSLPKSILLDCNFWRQTHIVSVSLNIPSGYDFFICSIASFLGVGTSRWRLSA